jgi:hypothetical protein
MYSRRQDSHESLTRCCVARSMGVGMLRVGSYGRCLEVLFYVLRKKGTIMGQERYGS